MTDWTDFIGNLENGVLVTVELMLQIINNTSNIYERVNVLESMKGGGVPIGGIMLWKGTLESIPEGFQLADGTNGTPDLRERFLMGIASTESDNNLLETGGETQHLHTLGAITKATKHKHTVYLNNSSATVAVGAGYTGGAHWSHNHSWSAETNTADEHTHDGTYSATNHLPYFTKYYWIVRIPA